MTKYSEELRAVTGILALVLVVLIFATSTIQGERPDDTLIDVLVPLVGAYLGSDVLAAIGNRKRQNKDE